MELARTATLLRDSNLFLPNSRGLVGVCQNLTGLQKTQVRLAEIKKGLHLTKLVACAERRPYRSDIKCIEGGGVRI